MLEKSPNEIQIIRWALQTAEALNYMHTFSKEIKMINRDVKPPHMVLNEESDGTLTIKLCDFSIARTLTSYAFTDNIGTINYMAPEVFIQGKGYTEKCDVYSWALSFWRCFSKEMPFADCYQYDEKSNSKSALVRAEKKIPDRALPDIPIISNLSDRMNKIIQKCYNYEPKNRPSMEEVVQELEKLLKIPYVLLNEN